MMIDEPERERRRALLHAHYRVENAHDLEGIMATFSKDAEMLWNGRSFADDASIRWGHGYIGLGAAPGAFRDVRNVIVAEHFTDDEIVVEGRLLGTHVGEFLGYPPTERAVDLPFVGFYRFDSAGKLVSERIVMNLSPLTV